MEQSAEGKMKQLEQQTTEEQNLGVQKREENEYIAATPPAAAGIKMTRETKMMLKVP